MLFHQFRQSITDKKCNLFLDSLRNVFHCSYKFQTLQWFVPAEGKPFLLFLGNPTFRRLFPPGTLFHLLFLILVQMILIQQKQFIFTKISSWRCKCIREKMSTKVFWSYMELTIPQNLLTKTTFFLFIIFFQINCFVLCFSKIALVFHK